MSVRRDLPFATMLWQAHTSAWTLTAVCKLTFDLEEGELALAATQERVYEQDRHWEDDRERSLVSASDLAPTKHGCDVVLVGPAFAPNGGVARAVIARLSVGAVDKSIEAHVERVVSQDGVVVEGAPFSRMRIVYERAAGGPGTWNPAGIRPGTRDAYGRTILPNVTIPGRGAPPHAIEPIGLGPIAPSWSIRAERARHHLAVLQSPHWRERPLPTDLDPSFFNVAPPDQRLASIAEDASIVLEGLHPKLAVLRAHLPGSRPRMFYGRRGVRAELELRTDTLAFDTERSLCTLTWRGQLPLEHAAEVVDLHVELDESKPPSSAVARSQASIRHGVLPFAAMAPHAPPVASPPRGGLPFAQEARPVPAAPPSGSGLRFGPASPPIAPRFEPPASVPMPSPPSVPMPSPPSVPMPSPPSVAMPAPAPPAPRASLEPRPVEVTHEADLLQLLWLDPAALSGISRNPDWKKILDGLVDTARDPQVDQPGFGEDAEGADARRQVFELLSRGAAAREDVDVQDGLAAGARKDGSFEPWLLLVEGELRFDFDELETLKAHIAAAIPFAPKDSALEKVVDEVTQFLRTPKLVVSGEVLEGMSRRIQAAFKDVPRSLGLEYLAEQTERALIERQGFQRRDVFEAIHTRAQLFFPEAQSGLPTYLREDLSERLPLFRRLPVKMLVEVRFPEDASERRRIALRALAVARVIRARRARS